jgi:hypothetical protein
MGADHDDPGWIAAAGKFSVNVPDVPTVGREHLTPYGITRVRQTVLDVLRRLPKRGVLDRAARADSVRQFLDVTPQPRRQITRAQHVVTWVA